MIWGLTQKPRCSKEGARLFVSLKGAGLRQTQSKLLTSRKWFKTMANEQIKEIDISKQARALRFLRFTDYLLIIVGGSWLLGLLGVLVVGPNLGGFDWVFYQVTVSVLFWGMYSLRPDVIPIGRHVKSNSSIWL